MKTCVLVVLLLASISAVAHPGEGRATCKPTGTCRACKTCSSCKNCAKNGGTCSVCSKAGLVYKPAKKAKRVAKR